jgi:5-methylcytosine-specific restriction protein A
MPDAPLRPCLEPGCPVLVSGGGRCPAHTRQYDHRRGSAASRGYDARWAAHRARYFHKLIALDILPACGARLPGAPMTADSRCQAEGRLITDGLERDHIVPHRGDAGLFWDPLNLQLLCRSCHSRKTMQEQQGRRPEPPKDMD